MALPDYYGDSAGLSSEGFDDSQRQDRELLFTLWHRCRRPVRSGRLARFAQSDEFSRLAPHVEREIFTLPVEIQPEAGEPDSILPGAPFAFRQNRIVSVVDTSRIDYPKGLSGSLSGELKAYFAGKNFKSFLCIPILGKDGMPVGVLNIDSHRKAAFGVTEDELESVTSIAIPFCVLLGAIIQVGGTR